MNILDKIKSTEQPDNAEGFIFDVQGTPYYRTSYAIGFVAGTFTFTPVAIRRSGFSFSSDMAAVECTVELRSTDNIVQSLILENFKDGALLAIKKYFMNDLDEGYEIFRGALTDISVSGGVCSLVFKNGLRHFEKSICRVRMQSLCNNILFDTVCSLDRDDFLVSTHVIVDTTGKELTNNDFIEYGDGYFTLGICQFNGVKRLITKHVDDTIFLSRTIYGLVTNSLVSVWPGCDKTPEKCNNTYSNIDNFVGMPYIPLKDPNEVAITNG